MIRHLVPYWLIGCLLALLAIHLAGCGSVTAVPLSDSPPDASATEIAALDLGQSGDLPGSSDASPDIIASPDGGTGDSQPGVNQGADGREVTPVCPVGLRCDVQPAHCPCPICTAIVDQKCFSDGFCICPKM